MRTLLALVTVLALGSGCYHRHTIDLARLPTERQDDGEPIRVLTTGGARTGDLRDGTVYVHRGEDTPSAWTLHSLWREGPIPHLDVERSDGSRWTAPLRSQASVEVDRLDPGLTTLASILVSVLGTGALVGALALGLGSCDCVAIRIGVW